MEDGASANEHSSAAALASAAATYQKGNVVEPSIAGAITVSTCSGNIIP